MKLITIRFQILEVAKRWKSQYVGGKHEQADKIAIYANLLKLDLTTCSAETIASTIGNDSWACPQKCYECGGRFNAVLQIGQEPDYESATTYLCIGCIASANALMEKQANA
jgi:hypothetical protein